MSCIRFFLFFVTWLGEQIFFIHDFKNFANGVDLHILMVILESALPAVLGWFLSVILNVGEENHKVVKTCVLNQAWGTGNSRIFVLGRLSASMEKDMEPALLWKAVMRYVEEPVVIELGRLARKRRLIDHVQLPILIVIRILSL